MSSSSSLLCFVVVVVVVVVVDVVVVVVVALPFSLVSFVYWVGLVFVPLAHFVDTGFDLRLNFCSCQLLVSRVAFMYQQRLRRK